MSDPVIKDRRLNLGRYPVWMRPLRSGQPIVQPIGSIGLEVPPDLIKLLPRIPHDLAGSVLIRQFACKLKQRQLATRYLLFRGPSSLSGSLTTLSNLLPWCPVASVG